MSVRVQELNPSKGGRPPGLDGLVHDLANILQMAKGHLDLALLNPHESEKRLKIARLAVSRAASLANLARQRNDYREFCLLFEIPGLISEAVVTALPSPSIQVSFNFDSLEGINERCGLWISRLGFYRTVQNIAWNSFQAFQQEGRFAVSASIKPGGECGGLVLTFDDDGPGTDETNLEQLLEAGFSKRSGGEGLGLAIVRECVENWGGSVLPSNLPEGGLRIQVVLPLCSIPSSTGDGQE